MTRPSKTLSESELVDLADFMSLIKINYEGTTVSFDRIVGLKKIQALSYQKILKNRGRSSFVIMENYSGELEYSLLMGEMF